MAKVSKVVKSNGDVIMDISGDTVTADNLLVGATAHGSDGEPVRGAVVMPTTVSLTGAVEGSGSFNNGTASIAVNRRACNVGNTTSTAAPGTPWYLFAKYTIPASNTNFNRITFLVQTGFSNTTDTLNTTGILDVVTRVRTETLLRMNWILSGANIVTDNFVGIYNANTREVSLYAKIESSYTTYRFVVLAESSNYNNADIAELWTLYDTRKGDTGNIAALPTGDNITTAYSGLANVETGIVNIISPAIDRTEIAPSSERAGKSIKFVDNNNKQIGIITPTRLTDGRERLYIAVNSESNGSFTTNYLVLEVATDGTCSYKVSDKEAFRTAIDCPQNKQLTNENLNNISTPGFYNATSTNTCTNVPVAGSFGLLVIHTASTNYWKQYFYPIDNTAKPYFRSGNNGTWTAWKQESSDDIVAMTGYSKPATTSAIETTDTLNAAIGKLEKENEILRNALSQSTFIIPEGTTTITQPIITDITKYFYYIPDSVTSIGDYAFGYCKSLTSITIPNNVTSIGRYAFYGCESLTSITIPNSVTSIGDYAFRDCTSLTKITVNKPQDSISGAPWGAPNATVTWTG